MHLYVFGIFGTLAIIVINLMGTYRQKTVYIERTVFDTTSDNIYNQFLCPAKIEAF
jgi:hypothetical protein